MTETPNKKPRLPPGSPCTGCGKCCTNARFMGSLFATGKDVKRWRREGRDDILRYAAVLGPASNPHADLWIDPKTGDSRQRCPFVLKVPGTKRYTCTIHDTRPQVCRNYEPWSGDPNDVCEIVT
jgi:Fe-S-cluster containining protein